MVCAPYSVSLRSSTTCLSSVGPLGRSLSILLKTAKPSNSPAIDECSTRITVPVVLIWSATSPSATELRETLIWRYVFFCGSTSAYIYIPFRLISRVMPFARWKTPSLSVHSNFTRACTRNRQCALCSNGSSKFRFIVFSFRAPWTSFPGTCERYSSSTRKTRCEMYSEDHAQVMRNSERIVCSAVTLCHSVE